MYGIPTLGRAMLNGNTITIAIPPERKEKRKKRKMNRSPFLTTFLHFQSFAVVTAVNYRGGG